MLDEAGSGYVERAALRELLDRCGVHPKTRDRWISHALNLGIFTYHHFSASGTEVYFLSSLDRAAQALDVDRIGHPVRVGINNLLDTGWKAHVWAGFEARSEKTDLPPKSQETKARITGVSPRDQRRYLNQLDGVKKVQNYAPRRKTQTTEKHVQGMKDVTGHAYFQDGKGRLNQRLPDIVLIPTEIAEPAPKGRSKKAQKRLTAALSNEGQGQCKKPDERLFYFDRKGAEKAIRERGEGSQVFLFQVHREKWRVNEWQPITL